MIVVILVWVCAPFITSSPHRPTGRLFIVSGAILVWMFLSARQLVEAIQEYTKAKIITYLTTKDAELGKYAEPKDEDFDRDLERYTTLKNALKDNHVLFITLFYGRNISGATRHVINAIFYVVYKIFEWIGKQANRLSWRRRSELK